MPKNHFGEMLGSVYESPAELPGAGRDRHLPPNGKDKTALTAIEACDDPLGDLLNVAGGDATPNRAGK